MSFGSCCFFDEEEHEYSLMKAKSVEVKGEEFGLLVNFELSQTFYHEESSAKEVSYIFPNDLKMCIYDTTFVVGEEIIKPKLEPKEEAKKTYEEAVKKGHTAVYGSNLRNGLTQFKLGNIPPSTECRVIIKVAFTANMTKQNSFFIKFPLDVCTPSGSTGCLDVMSSNFLFQLQCDKEKINKVTSNVKNINYDNSTKLLTINNEVKNNDNEHSIIITFETKENIQSSVLVGDTTNDYNNCAVTISPNIDDKSNESTTEFVFVIDCSGSMSGRSIKKAAECLELFIRSLPENSYFNVIRFGSSYDKLFKSSVKYNERNIKKALNLASHLEADLGGTQIYRPLKDVYSNENEFGQRQIFIMTDGEVWDVSEVIELVSENCNNNRCFTIGIGRGCDAGLVEGIANSSGGKCDFVQEGDSISEKVIPQLQCSLQGNLTSIEVNIEGQDNDSFQISPYPLPILPSKGSCVIYLRSKKKDDSNQFENGFLITANYGGETVEIPIEENEKIEKKDEDKFGCSDGHNVGKAILPLFAFNLLKKYEKKNNISEDERKKAIELSISSGVLCKFTGYVGISKDKKVEISSSDDEDSAPNKCCKKKAKAMSSDSDDDEDSAPNKCCKKKAKAMSSDSDDDEDSAPKKKKCCKKIAKAMSSDSDDSEDLAPKKKKCCKKKAKAMSSDSDDSDSDIKMSPAPKRKICCKKKAMDSDFEDSESSQSDEEIPAKKVSDSDSEEKEKELPKKRATRDSDSDDSDDEKPAKKKAAMPIRKAKKRNKCCKAKAKPRIIIKDIESDSDSEEKEKELPKKRATRDSDSDDSDDEKSAKKKAAMPIRKAKKRNKCCKAKAKAKPRIIIKDIESDSDSEEKEKELPQKRATRDSDSDDSDKEKPAKKKAAMPIRKAKPRKRISDDSSSDERPKRKALISKKPKSKPKQEEEDEEEEVPHAKKVSKPKQKPYDLMSLLRLQDFHGYWEDLDEINAMLGSNISRIKGVDVKSTELTKKCVATILAIAALHVKSNNENNLWMMIEQKAIKWLNKTLPKANITQLIKDTESLIK